MRPDQTVTDVESLARELAEQANIPRRRVRPRLAHVLRPAQSIEVLTPSGAVSAWRLGAGPAVLLVHGWEDDNTVWAPLIKALVSAGKAVVAWDLPGHGFSKAQDASLLSIGEAVLSLAAAVGPIGAVVSHSYGCHAALYALAKGLRAELAVMLASSLPRAGNPTAGAWSRRLINAGVPSDVATAAWALRVETFDVAPGFRAEPAIASMTAKALLIHSLDDELAPAANSEKMAVLWPKSELMLTQDLGHRGLMQDPAVIARIVGFL